MRNINDMFYVLIYEIHSFILAYIFILAYLSFKLPWVRAPTTNYQKLAILAKQNSEGLQTKIPGQIWLTYLMKGTWIFMLFISLFSRLFLLTFSSDTPEVVRQDILSCFES